MKIIRIAQENWYTREVAQNPNTSPDILRKILEKGFDDNVSWTAAINPNCPPDALKMVLERGKDDAVSFRASKHPNCPPGAKIEWKKNTGQELTKEEQMIEQTIQSFYLHKGIQNTKAPKVTEPNKPNKLEELKATPEEIRDFELNYMSKDNKMKREAKLTFPIVTLDANGIWDKWKRQEISDEEFVVKMTQVKNAKFPGVDNKIIQNGIKNILDVHQTTMNYKDVAHELNVLLSEDSLLSFDNDKMPTEDFL